MQQDQSFESMMQAVTQLPPAWMPRREQPSWDRDFNGKADINAQFGHKTEAAREWLAFALAFSETLTSGYEGLDNVRKAGRDALMLYGPKGKHQF